MRSLPFQDSGWEEADGSVAAELAEVIAFPAVPEPFVPGARWSEGGGRISWPSALAAGGFTATLLFGMVTMDVIKVSASKPKAVVVTLMELPKDPPAVPPSDPKVEPVKQLQPVIVAPKPIVQPPQLVQAAPIVTAPEPPPVRAAVVAPAQPGPTGPVSVADLDSKMVSAKPPKYPVESRRKKEQGTVVLTVLLSTAGAVADVSVSRSSGFSRLDKAALDAVRRWQWSPTVVNGAAVMVKGFVEIPFVLQG